MAKDFTMKLIVDISDNKIDGFLKILKNYSNVKAQPLSARDFNVLEEVHHIKKAMELADQVKTGKIKSRPASDLLNEI